METDVAKTATRKRGRPKCDSRQVADRLLAAAENLLQQHGHLEATERKIAADAGTSVAMIHYYFGDKDGLLFAVVDHLASQVSEAFASLFDTLEQHAENPTRVIVSKLVEAYYSKPWLLIFMWSTMTQKNSVMQDKFMKRYGSRGMTGIQRLLDRLVAAGVYDRNVDTRYASLCLFSTITGALAHTTFSEITGITADELRKDGWIDYLTDLFDRQLRPKV